MNRSHCYLVAVVPRIDALGIRELKRWQACHTPAQTVLLLTCVDGVGFPATLGTRVVSTWQYRAATPFHGLAGGLLAAAPVGEAMLECV